MIEKYPDFKAMYEQVYEICRNIEQVMGMFSKELYELDRNTVRYMIDELQEGYQKQKEEIAYLKEQNKKSREENEWLLKEIEQIKRSLGQGHKNMAAEE